MLVLLVEVRILVFSVLSYSLDQCSLTALQFEIRMKRVSSQKSEVAHSTPKRMRTTNIWVGRPTHGLE